MVIIVTEEEKGKNKILGVLVGSDYCDEGGGEGGGGGEKCWHINLYDSLKNITVIVYNYILTFLK